MVDDDEEKAGEGCPGVARRFERVKARVVGRGRGARDRARGHLAGGD